MTSTLLALTSASPMRAVVCLVTMPLLMAPERPIAPAPAKVPPTCTMRVLSAARTRTAEFALAPPSLIFTPSRMLASVTELIKLAVEAPVCDLPPATATPTVAVIIFSLLMATTDKPLTASSPLAPGPPEIPSMALPSDAFAAAGLTALPPTLNDAPPLTLPSEVPSRSMSALPL